MIIEKKLKMKKKKTIVIIDIIIIQKFITKKSKS